MRLVLAAGSSPDAAGGSYLARLRDATSHAGPATLGSYMRRGNRSVRSGTGTTSPNPPVGCVILDSGGRIVGEGYHARKGEPHAETQALAAAGEWAAGGTTVVTLEPCNHHGRTPPCHQALIDAEMRQVVISTCCPRWSSQQLATSKGLYSRSLRDIAGWLIT